MAKKYIGAGIIAVALLLLAGVHFGVIDFGTPFMLRYSWDPQIQSFSCIERSGGAYDCHVSLWDNNLRCQAYGGRLDLVMAPGTAGIPSSLGSMINAMEIRAVELDGEGIGSRYEAYASGYRLVVALPLPVTSALPCVAEYDFIIYGAEQADCYKDSDCAVPAIAVENGHYEARCIDNECLADIICDYGYVRSGSACVPVNPDPGTDPVIVPATVGLMIIGLMALWYLRSR